jgi:hypothetical protein
MEKSKLRKLPSHIPTETDSSLWKQFREYRRTEMQYLSNGFNAHCGTDHDADVWLRVMEGLG